MSTVGPSGQGHEPAADPWTDLTDPVAPVSPTPPVFQQGHAQPAQPYQPTRFQPDTAPAWVQPGYDSQPLGRGGLSDFAEPQPEYAAQQAYNDADWGAPPRQRNTAVVVLSTMLAVVLLAGLGVGAYLFLNRSSPPAVIPTAGQCVQSNQESEPDTRMSIVTCEPGALKVLKTVNGTDQVTECDGVAGLSDVYHFTASSGPLSDTYVLCLGES